MSCHVRTVRSASGSGSATRDDKFDNSLLEGGSEGSERGMIVFLMLPKNVWRRVRMITSPIDMQIMIIHKIFYHSGHILSRFCRRSSSSAHDRWHEFIPARSIMPLGPVRIHSDRPMFMFISITQQTLNFSQIAIASRFPLLILE